MFFFPFLFSAIPNLDLGILKMLLRVYFVIHYNQQSINLFPVSFDSQPVWLVNIQYLQ